MEEIRIFLHHVKCNNCEYEEKDVFVVNEGNRGRMFENNSK